MKQTSPVDHYELNVLTTQRRKRLLRIEANVIDLARTCNTYLDWLGRGLVKDAKVSTIYADGKRKTLYRQFHLSIH